MLGCSVDVINLSQQKNAYWAFYNSAYLRSELPVRSGGCLNLCSCSWGCWTPGLSVLVICPLIKNQTSKKNLLANVYIRYDILICVRKYIAASIIPPNCWLSVIFSDHTHRTLVCNKLPSDQDGFVCQMLQGSNLAEIHTQLRGNVRADYLCDNCSTNNMLTAVTLPYRITTELAQLKIEKIGADRSHQPAPIVCYRIPLPFSKWLIQPAVKGIKRCRISLHLLGGIYTIEYCSCSVFPDVNITL